MNFIKPFIISGVFFLILDICWLFFANKKIYQPNIGNLMGDRSEERRVGKECR
ncbi:MAG TPA: hypothetical protein DCM20_02535, partial [Lactococcus lactis]|nr:hypothetical protein [Lactococcus lactis]